MKNILFLIINLWLCVGCSSTRKTAEITTATQYEAVSNEKTDASFNIRLDSTRLNDLEIIYTKVEYFNPVETTEPENAVLIESNLSTQSNKNAIKTIEQIKINHKEEVTIQQEQTGKVETEATEFESYQNQSEEILEEKPVPDPFRWRYMFYTFVLILLACIVFKFKGKTIFRFIKNLF